MKTRTLEIVVFIGIALTIIAALVLGVWIGGQSVLRSQPNDTASSKLDALYSDPLNALTATRITYTRYFQTYEVWSDDFNAPVLTQVNVDMDNLPYADFGCDGWDALNDEGQRCVLTSLDSMYEYLEWMGVADEFIYPFYG